MIRFGNELRVRHNKVGVTARTGIGAGSLISTARGIIPVEQLLSGDRVITRDGAARLIRVSRHLHEGALVRISPSSLGHGRPDTALLLCPDQAVLMRDWRAKVIYGADEVLVAAKRLVDGEFIAFQENARPIWCFDLMFERPCIVNAGGVDVASAPLRMPVRLVS